jgi:hypothetical protein
MAVCGVCGRMVEVSDSGQSMPCICIKTPLGQFLRYAIDTCINPELPSLEVEDGRLVDFEEDYDA